MSEFYRVRNTIKYPTSLIVNAANNVGLELASSLLEQGGYVVLVDVMSDANLTKVFDKLGQHGMFTVLDYSAVPHLEEDLRRLDYVFHLQHEYRNLETAISSQDFLRYSNYLDSTLQLAVRFEAKYLLTTSMAAHQLYLATAPDADLQTTRAGFKPSTYNAMELQRYAENLLLEYVNNANINGRILRLGEVIGEGIDFLRQTTFNKLLLATAASQPITVPGDGLESDWYVHVLDAAYAIVKAQFTKDTVGNIYSVHFDSPFTALSIAYKLQDVETMAKEIEFDYEQATPPQLRLYRPAPSLSEIGWKPNVTFEQAIKDSLASAKTFLLTAADEDLQAQLGSSNSILERLRHLVSHARNGNPVEEETEGGPVSRLIAQRKQQEEQKEESVSQANSYIRNRRRQRDLTLGQQLDKLAWGFTNGIAEKFTFLRKVSPGEFAAYTLILIIGIFLYFTILSPTLVFGRNLIVLSDELGKLAIASTQSQFQQISDSNRIINSALKENITIWTQVKPFFNFFSAGGVHTGISDTLTAWQQVSDSTQRLASGMGGLQSYLNSYKNNIRLRGTSDNLLAVNEPSSYASELTKAQINPAIIDTDRARIVTAKQTLGNVAQTLPGFLRSWGQETTGALLSAADKVYNFADVANYGGEMLGKDNARNYFVAILDNSRPTPLGGTVAAFAVLSVKDGAVLTAQVQPLEAATINVSNLPAYLISELNMTQFAPIARPSFADLAYLRNVDDFSDAVKHVWRQQFNTEIDLVVTFNLNTLGDWTQLFADLQLEQQPVNSTNLLRTIQLLQASSSTVARRHDLIAQLTASLIEQTSIQLPTKFYAFLDVVSKNAVNKNVQIGNSNFQFNNVVSTNPLLQGKFVDTEAHATAFFSYDQRIANADKFASVSLAQIINLSLDSTLKGQNYYLKFPNLSNIDFVSICTSNFIAKFFVLEFPMDRLKVNRGSQDTCYVMDIVGEISINATWESVAFDQLGTRQYNVTVGIGKQSGVDITADIEFNFPAELEVLESTPSLQISGGKSAVKLPIQANQTIKFAVKLN